MLSLKINERSLDPIPSGYYYSFGLRTFTHFVLLFGSPIDWKQNWISSSSPAWGGKGKVVRYRTRRMWFVGGVPCTVRRMSVSEIAIDHCDLWHAVLWYMEPPTGFEPVTLGLRYLCSTS